jgi:hypothetical protein
MKNYDELIAMLAQGASISRERNMNLDFAKVADSAATAIQELQAEVAEYRKAADDMAAAHKVERDELLERGDYWQSYSEGSKESFAIVMAEKEALRAKLAALEGQEPVAWCDKDGMHYRHDLLINEGLKLYLAAGAAPQPAEAKQLDGLSRAVGELRARTNHLVKFGSPQGETK